MKTFATVLAGSLAITFSQAALYQFDISPPGTDKAVGLSASNEVSVPLSAGTGGEVSGGIVYDSDAGVLHVAIGYGSAAGFTDLSAPATAMHFHGPAGTGTNAGVLISLVPYHFVAADPAKGGVIVGSLAFPPAQLTNLFNGLLYVNVHTTNYPGGEIRGQLTPVTPLNTAPSLLCPAGAQVECGSPATLSATVSDADGDAMTVWWSVNGAVVQTNTVPAGLAPSGAVVSFTGEFLFGSNVIAVTVADSQANSSSCSSVVTVVDTIPPVITSTSVNPKTLWPVNHKMIPVTVSARVEDTCGPTTWKIVSVTSNEPLNGKGDGNTSSDWKITGDHTVQLRAERSGKGNGRVYSITIIAKDQGGNTAQSVVTVLAPKSQGQK